MGRHRARTASCHTQGRTVDEARRRIREALEWFVDDAHKVVHSLVDQDAPVSRKDELGAAARVRDSRLKQRGRCTVLEALGRRCVDRGRPSAERPRHPPRLLEASRRPLIVPHCSTTFLQPRRKRCPVLHSSDHMLPVDSTRRTLRPPTSIERVDAFNRGRRSSAAREEESE